MQPVEFYIRELLYEYDCVIVPQLGGFLTQSRPARLFRDKRRIYPPSRSVTFNALLVHEDGLLASRISRMENISYRDAVVKVRDFAEHLRNILSSGQSVYLESIGTLSQAPEGNTIFLPVMDANFEASTYGMDSIYLHPITAEVPVQKQLKKPVDRKPVMERNRHTVRKKSPASVKWTLALSLPVILFLLYGIIFPVSFQDLYTSYSGILTDSFRIKTEAPQHHTGAAQPEPVQETVAIPSELPAPAPKTETVTPEAKPVLKEEAKSVHSIRFYIIGGCFENEDNAQKFLADLISRGYEAEEAGTNLHGHLRISYKSFPVRQDALLYLDEIKAKENPAAWLLKY
jgi:hypothetical protein